MYQDSGLIEVQGNILRHPNKHSVAAVVITKYSEVGMLWKYRTQSVWLSVHEE